MNVDAARERLANARATVVLYDDLLLEAERLGAGEGELRRLRGVRDDAILTRDVAEGELIYAEAMG
jgi:hypothetical protein